MTSNDANAREGILYLLCHLPDDVKTVYRTPNELAKLLIHGGASSSIDGAIVKKAVQFASPKYKPNITSRQREKVPGLDGCQSTYRFSTAVDTATPKSQRLKEGGNIVKEAELDTVLENYFQTSQFRSYLDTISAYFHNRYIAAQSIPPDTAMTDNIHMKEGIRCVEIPLEREMFKMTEGSVKRFLIKRERRRKQRCQLTQLVRIPNEVERRRRRQLVLQTLVHTKRRRIE